MKNRNNPLVSIITVCLNSEKTIEQTIKSVLGQTYKNIEYIIVDGQSSDGTLDIINKYRSQIAKVVSEPDEGLYYAMNKGISMATGDIIGIINSDDWYETYAVEEVVACFRKTNADLVYGDMMEVHKNENRLMIANNLEELRVFMIIPHPTVFIRKKVYNICGGFDIRYKVVADYDLMLRLYNMGFNFQKVKRVLANFRMGGVSSREEELAVKESYRIAREHCEGIEKEDREFVLEKIITHFKGYYFVKMLKENPQQISSRIIHILQENGVEETIIFGSGTWGRTVGKKLLDDGIKILCYIDNDSKKWGSMIDGIKVLGPGMLYNYTGLVFVLVHRYSKEILEQIEQMDNSNIRSIDWKILVEL